MQLSRTNIVTNSRTICGTHECLCYDSSGNSTSVVHKIFNVLAEQTKSQKGYIQFKNLDTVVNWLHPAKFDLVSATCRVADALQVRVAEWQTPPQTAMKLS